MSAAEKAEKARIDAIARAQFDRPPKPLRKFIRETIDNGRINPSAEQLAEWSDLFGNVLSELQWEDGDDELLIDAPGRKPYALTRQELRTLVMATKDRLDSDVVDWPDPFLAIGENLASGYMGLVCDRANKGPGPHPPTFQIDGLDDAEDDGDGSDSSSVEGEFVLVDDGDSNGRGPDRGGSGTSSPAKTPQNVRTKKMLEEKKKRGRERAKEKAERALRDPSPHIPGLSCIALSSAMIEILEWGNPDQYGDAGSEAMEAWDGEFARWGIGAGDTAALMALDYVFLPWYQSNRHFVLIGIAPKQKFIVFIDPVTQSFWEDDLFYGKELALQHIACVLFTYFAAGVPLADHPDDECELLPGWQLVEPKKTSSEWRIWASQYDSSSCGPFMLTNVSCLAFGYSLLCFSEKDLAAKRWRIAAELIRQGFRSALALTAPTIPTVYADFPIAGTETRHLTRGQIERALRDALETPLEGNGPYAMGRFLPPPPTTISHPAQFPPHLFTSTPFMRAAPAVDERPFDAAVDADALAALAILAGYGRAQVVFWRRQGLAVFRAWMEDQAVLRGTTLYGLEVARSRREKAKPRREVARKAEEVRRAKREAATKAKEAKKGKVVKRGRW